ncbi:EAL domain-containing protein [Motiliproteus sediminis]|uniref:EAL domain-containing protein n=1 Tax=Motiliproteus sediminis TaxID=1468178 RepID=UPI001AEFAF40|nr:EAL domain-containing protein [Motiliproteus sediminis]
MANLRQNLNILFTGISSSDSEPTVSLLRAARLNPRAEQAASEAQLRQQLNERSWDLILFAENDSLSLEQLADVVKNHSKDIPVVVIAPDNATCHRMNGLKHRAAAVVPSGEKELLALVVRRELYHLENRRRRRQAEFLLVESEKRCHELLHSSTDAITLIDKQNHFIYMNPAFQALLGLDSSESYGNLSIEMLASGEELSALKEIITEYHRDPSVNRELDLLAKRKDGSQFQANLFLSQARFERSLCTQVIVRTPQEDAAMESLAEQDLVTGLKNQVFLAKRLDQSVQAAVRADQEVNLLYITLDNFNGVKAEIGVNGADAVVRDVADILQKMVNRAHVLTRYNLDAFAIIYGDADSQKAVDVAERIRHAIERNITEVAGAKIQTTCSIGVTPINADSASAQEVLRLAQTASESVRGKNKSGNGVHLHIPVEQDEDDGLSVKKLRNAIKENQFKLLFQPVVSLRGEHESVYEVLLRLLDKDENQISPNMFMTMLDHAEVSVELDRWVIAESIRQLAEEQNKGHKNRLFINLTGRSLEDPRLLHWIRDQLKEHNVAGDSLIFQFSESDASSYLRYANIFAQGLVQLHATACIKHYGSSIDSENVLRHVPAKYIKLDGSFVQELDDPDKHEAFDKLVEPLRLGEKTVIAPLVEGTNVMSKLFRSGVHYIQGYYLQAPRERMDYDFFTDG